jgi:hypothetical protein
MKSVSHLSCPQPPSRSRATRREFLKTSLVSSVGAVTVSATALGASIAAKAESKAEPPSIITMTNGGPPRRYANHGRLRLRPGSRLYSCART